MSGGKITAIVTPQAIRQIVIDRAGVAEFFSYTEFCELLENFSRFHFQLASQLIYADLTHTEAVCILPCFPGKIPSHHLHTTTLDLQTSEAGAGS